MKTRPAVILTGARQTGKTSLLRHAYPRHRFVSLDLPTQAEMAEKTPSDFLRLHPPPLIIDECQYAPALFRHLKVAIDGNRELRGQFILIGSQQHTMIKHVGDSLAGRLDVLQLETLSRRELLRHQPSLPLTRNILLGGYPELHASADLDPVRFYLSYTATYLERDVRSMAGVGSLRDFERFMRAAALRSGQLLNKAELARDVGITPTTANTWLGILQASGVVALLEPWFSNKLKSVVKSPKIYFMDCGLLCALMDIRSEEELLRSPRIGAIWETFVFSEIRKAQQRRDGIWRAFFLSDRSSEVDFLIHHGGRYDLWEAKWTEHPGRHDASAVLRFSESLGARNIESAAILCRTPNSFPVTESVHAHSVEWLWNN